MLKNICDIGFHKQRIGALFEGASIFVLPYPYARGHLRVRSEESRPAPKGYAFAQAGRECFVRLEEGLLCKIAGHMAAEGAEDIDPSVGEMHTLFYQILRKTPGAPCMDKDTALLIRAAMDVPQILEGGNKKKADTLLSLVQGPLKACFALCLSRGEVSKELYGAAKYLARLLNTGE